MVSGKPCLMHHSRPGEMRSFTLSRFASVILSPGTTSAPAGATSIVAVTASAAASLRVLVVWFVLRSMLATKGTPAHYQRSMAGVNRPEAATGSGWTRRSGGTMPATTGSRLILRPLCPRPRGRRHAPHRRSHERQEVVDVGRADLGLHLRECRAHVGRHAEEHAERRGECPDAGGVEARAAEPDAVQPAHGMGPVHDGEWWDVAARARKAAHDREPPDPAVLVDDAVPRDEGLVLDHHVTAEQRARGDDHLAPEPAVVTDVRLRHQGVVVADLGPGLGLRGALYLGVLAEHVAIADPESGQRSRIAEVLRLVAEYRSGVHDVVGAELGASGEVGAGHDPGPRSDAHRAVDDDVGADLRRRVDLRRAVDERRRGEGHALLPVVL